MRWREFSSALLGCDAMIVPIRTNHRTSAQQTYAKEPLPRRTHFMALRAAAACGSRPPYFTENANTVVWSYFSPFFSSQLGKAGLFGVSGKNCVSRHSASRF